MDIPTKCFAIVIGSGPNGLYALSKLQETYPNEEVYAIDKGEVLNNFYDYPNVRFHSTIKELGFDNYKYSKHEDDYKPDTLDMIDYYLSFKEVKNLKIYENVEMKNISKNTDNSYNVTVLVNTRTININSKNIILATGLYENPVYLGIQGEKTNPKISHYCYDYDDVDENIIVVGSGNSAADYIIKSLPNNKINWIIRNSDKTFPRIGDIIREKLDFVLNKYSSNLTIYYNSIIIDSFSDKLYFKSDDNENLIEFDKCYLFTGFKINEKFYKKMGFPFVKGCFKYTRFSMETDFQNVYVFGALSCQFCPIKQKIEHKFLKDNGLTTIQKILNNIQYRYY